MRVNEIAIQKISLSFFSIVSIFSLFLIFNFFRFIYLIFPSGCISFPSLYHQLSFITQIFKILITFDNIFIISYFLHTRMFVGLLFRQFSMSNCNLPLFLSSLKPSQDTKYCFYSIFVRFASFLILII